jgi:four helix bundle protein
MVGYSAALVGIVPPMPIHQTLKAWQHAQRLAVECAKAVQRFPDCEQGALADQLRRAGYSVPLNIAEGCARKGTREYRRFLDIAWGSLAEVETALAMARDLAYLGPAEFGRLEALATETGKTLYGLLRKVSSDAAKPTHSR